MTAYTAHLARTGQPWMTACGETWQGWQEPPGYAARDPLARTLPPHEEPRPGDRVRQCQACHRPSVAVAEAERALTMRREATEALRLTLRGLSGVERADALRACLEAGVRPVELAELAGISRARLYQLLA